MPVYKDKRNGKYRYEKMLTLPNGRRKRIYGTPSIQTKKGAEAAERAHIESVLRGQRCEKRKEPVKYETFVIKFMKVCETRNKPSEVATKEMIFRVHLLPAFGKLKLNQITFGRIEDYVVTKRKRLSPKTINNHLTVLRSSLDNALERGLIDSIPRIKWLRVSPRTPEFYSKDDAAALIEAAETSWKPMIVLGLQAGLRQGELLALRWSDLDLKKKEVHIRQKVYEGHLGSPKSNRFRTIPLTTFATELLKSHRHLRSEYVFCKLDGKMFSKHKCRWPMYRACDKAGLPRKSWHILRHTFASHLAMSGRPLIAIKELLGHQTIEMTMKYAHLLPNTHRESISELEIYLHSGHSPDKKPEVG